MQPNFLEHGAAIGCKGSYPAEVARYLRITRLEAELALRMAVEMGVATRRRDGRVWIS